MRRFLAWQSRRWRSRQKTTASPKVRSTASGSRRIVTRYHFQPESRWSPKPESFHATGLLRPDDLTITNRLLYQLSYGWDDLPDNILQELGKQIIKMEREFNRRAGFTKEDGRIPKWMMKDAIPENGSVFDVSEEGLDYIFNNIE